MSDVGIKLAQIGKNVRNAADQDLNFSSSWPSLKILQEGFLPNPQLTGSDYIATVPHELGYTPFALIFYMFDGVSGYAKTFPTQYINTTRIKYQSSFEFIGQNYYYIIFDVDLAQNFQAPTVKVGDSAAPRNRNFGFKIANRGKTVQSREFKDFAVHSSTRSLMVHMVKTDLTEKQVRDTATFYTSGILNHNLPYRPLAFGFTEFTDGWRDVGDGSDLIDLTRGYMTGDSTSLEIQYSSADVGPHDRRYSLVVLKNPFDNPETTEAIST